MTAPQTPIDDGCWFYAGSISWNGYGLVGIRGDNGQWQNKVVHKLMYECLVGEVPEGLDLDHLCRNRSCINPDHLEVVTHSENILRGKTSALRAPYTKCRNGHAITPETTETYLWKGKIKRKCKVCSRKRSLDRYYRNKDEGGPETIKGADFCTRHQIYHGRKNKGCRPTLQSQSRSARSN